jgi:hypothetical protein
VKGTDRILGTDKPARGDPRYTPPVTNGLAPPRRCFDDGRDERSASMFEKKPAFKKFAFTFLGGVVAGAVLGLLYAPITGKKMQKKVAEVSDQVQQTVRKIANA